MTEYVKLAERLRKARRAWKRAAMFSGLALVLLELAGVFTLVILLSLFFGHVSAVRIALLVVTVAAAAFLVARHVALPLLRRIPDEQIALYVEERSKAFDGALVTAAEFGPRPAITSTQAGIVAAVVQEADDLTRRVRPSSVVSLARLRKYAVAAGIVLVAYAGMCLAFPGEIGRRVLGALRLWSAPPSCQPGPEGLALPAGMTPAEAARLLPIEFRLSRGDAQVQRSADFELEALLSRKPEAPVALSFRPAGTDLPWQSLPMRQIEKLHGYAGVLQAVSENMEFHVSTGPYKSGTYRITVYDKMEFRGFEVTVHYPDYLQFPDKTETLENGDVSAPVGSTATVRVLSTSPPASGKLLWDDGQEQALSPDPQRTNSAAASFPVEKNRKYLCQVTDVHGQSVKSASPATVYALKDNPPTPHRAGGDSPAGGGEFPGRRDRRFRRGRRGPGLYADHGEGQDHRGPHAAGPHPPDRPAGQASGDRPGSPVVDVRAAHPRAGGGRGHLLVPGGERPQPRQRASADGALHDRRPAVRAVGRLRAHARQGPRPADSVRADEAVAGGDPRRDLAAPPG
jgi:hypothetical protein